MENDLKNIRKLAIFHYVMAGVTALCSLFPCLYIFLGIFTILEGRHESIAIGAVFITIGSILLLMGMSLAVCILIAASKLAKHKSRIFCLVIASIMTFVPFGAPLAIFTIVILMKDSVKQIFDGVETAQKNA